MGFAFVVTDVIPASSDAIYRAWLDSDGHAGMTGGKAARISAAAGETYSVWNGYITGANLELEPGRRIVQSWRTTRFTAADPDSRIEVTLAPEGRGTRVTIAHSNVPNRHTSYRDGGWQNNYFEPMKRYFAAAR